MIHPSTANTLVLQGIDVEELELGRDPNLVKCTDNYEDEVDCRGTKKILAKFKKMEKQIVDSDKGTGDDNYISLKGKVFVWEPGSDMISFFLFSFFLNYIVIQNTAATNTCTDNRLLWA